MAENIVKAPFIICHSWKEKPIYCSMRLQTPQLSSESSGWFYSDALPNVKFNISIGGLEKEQLFVVVTKVPDNPAGARITVTLECCKEKSVNILNWTNNVLLDNIKFSPPRYSFSAVSGTCGIIWHGFISHPEPTPPINLYRQMKPFHAENDFADIEIIIGDTKIPAHKVVLAAQSAVFSTMFKSDMSESANNQIKIEDIDIRIMKQVTQFMYSGELDTDLDCDAVLSILSTAEKYQIIDLKQSCAEILSQKITLENSVRILEAAHLYRVPQLIERMNSFMVMNKQKIIQLDDYKDLYSKNPTMLSDFIERSIQEQKNFFCVFCRT